jgi:RHS repeat-associated protein
VVSLWPQYQRDLSGGLRTKTERDRLGQVTGHKIEKISRQLTEKSYLWGTNDKLLAIVTDGKAKHFEYDGWGNLSKTLFEDGKTELRNPDKVGNFFESVDRLDRKYDKGGQLLKTPNREYKYDQKGNLIRKKDKHGATWRYQWNAQGMLAKVIRPDAAEITFKYDALGRRIEKHFHNHVTRWIWDGNVPLHEQKEDYLKDYSEEKGEFWDVRKQPLVTWVFEEGTFVPTAKITNSEQLSIVTNYLGTPEAMYREDGETVWKCELNSYGKVSSFQGEFKTDCPFRYQGQYEDSETGLYYNRFRYYSPEEGMYISQDPIGLDGGIIPYGYVHDINYWLDIFGLKGEPQLPNSNTLSQGNTKIVHYYDNLSEHAEPIHFHIEENGKSIGKIKADGTLIAGRKNATTDKLVSQYKNKLRKAEKKIANYLRKVRKVVAGKPFKSGNRGCKG